MDTFREIHDRMMQWFQFESQEELAEELGLRANAYTNRKRAASIPYGQLLGLAERHALSADWIFFGIGEPRRSTSSLVGASLVNRLDDIDELLAGMDRLREFLIHHQQRTRGRRIKSRARSTRRRRGGAE